MPKGVYKRTPENTKNVGKSKSMLGKEPWNKGKHFIEEIKIKPCLQCGLLMERTFETKQNWNKKQYCNKRCMKLGSTMSQESKDKISNSKKGNIPWNKGVKGKQVAWNKGKKFPIMLGNKYAKGIKHPWAVNNLLNPKNKEKALKNLPRGDKHYKWKKDRTTLLKKEGSEERRSPMYKDWRKNVCTRDNWKCRLSSDECSGRLEVHHILGFKEYPQLRYIINNGITLCHFHHPKKREEEKRMIPIFQELLSVSSE